MALCGDAFALIGTGDGVELTTAYFVLYGIEMSSNRIDTGRIAYKDHFVGQMFGLQMEMKCASVLIDGELGGRKMSFCHSYKVLIKTKWLMKPATTKDFSC
jgi:hypothetical protein